MSLTVLGVDPGLEHVALCPVTFGRDKEAQPRSFTIGERCASDDIVDAILAEVGTSPVRIDAIAIENYVWRPAKVHNDRQITTGLAMSRMLGRVEERLRAYFVPVHWIRPQDSLRDMPFGREAKRLGIPGKNNHERSSYYQARWLLGTMRMGATA